METNNQLRMGDVEKDTVDELISEIETLETERNSLNQKIIHLESTNDSLQEQVTELMEETDKLKIDLLEARNIITEQESKFLSKMYDSKSDGDLAKEIINNLHE